MTALFDLLIKNVRVVRPTCDSVHEADIAIRNGKFAKIAGSIPVKEAKRVFDGKGRLAFPTALPLSIDDATYWRGPS
jgi:allantoinase